MRNETKNTLPFEPDPVIEFYKKDIDRTLIRQNLRRSVAERLQNLIAMHEWFDEAQRVRHKQEEPGSE